jgi:hypothetical protein
MTQNASHEALYRLLTALGHNVSAWRDDPFLLAEYAKAVAQNAEVAR